MRHSGKHHHSIFVRFFVAVLLCAFLAGAFVALANGVVIFSTRDQVHTVSTVTEELADDPADAVVVLGASVHADGTPSPILAHRLEVAVDLYQAGAARAIIVSGDNRDTHYNESDAMKAYCVDLGVPSKDIYVDHAGLNTYDSMYRATHVFGAKRLVVTTQAYHLYRAMYIAQCFGAQTWGVASDKGAYDNQRMYSLREVLARTKDFVYASLRIPANTPDDHVSLEESGDLT